MISSGCKCRERFPKSIRFAFDFLTDSMEVAFRTRNRETRVHRSCSTLAFHLALRSRFSLDLALKSRFLFLPTRPFRMARAKVPAFSFFVESNGRLQPTRGEKHSKRLAEFAEFGTVRLPNPRNSTQRTCTTIDVSE